MKGSRTIDRYSISRFLIAATLSAMANWIAGGALCAAPVDYTKEIKPILSRRCFACHGSFKQSGKLRLDTGAAIRQGGESGPAVVPNDSEKSLLLKVVTGEAGYRMPPENEGASLTADEIVLLKRWIEEGANSPTDESPAEDPRSFWSYQPVQQPAIPNTPSPEWPTTPIDSFIAAEHQAHKLVPNAPAERTVLLRRVYMDLVGLPPTRDELLQYLSDESPDAWDRVIDRLLASPQYGQRWGRHWMDVWRYSDWYGSRGGNEIRYSQRHIWRWRDWIVDSLNADKGYDQMVIEMLAGDELAPGDPDVIRATGFLGRNWYKFDRNVWMFETVEQTSQAFLGITMRCARCHDHKFDPITQRDYYHFRAFFEPHDVRTDPVNANLKTDKDATLGPVLKEGVSLVYDKDLESPTYLFQRGDSRYPNKDVVCSPAVPVTLSSATLNIEPVKLPMLGSFPSLRPAIVDALRSDSIRSVQAAEAAVANQSSVIEAAQKKLSDFDANAASTAQTKGVVLADDFHAPRPDVWKTAGGEWTYEQGYLVQKQPSTFPTFYTEQKLPQDFAARVRYRTTNIGTIHSVGVFFDVVKLADCQAVYTATNDKTSTAQAFHRQGGVEHYPGAGIVPWPVRIGQEVTLDLAVRGSLLNVWVNGELAIAYTMPMKRQEGGFGIWTHAGGAEFYEVALDPLPVEFQLSNAASEKRNSPYAKPTRTDLERQVELAKAGVALRQKELDIAKADQTFLDARIAADLAKANDAADTETRSTEACRAERTVALLRAELEQSKAQEVATRANETTDGNEVDRKKRQEEAQTKLTAAQKTLDAAKAALDKVDTTYTSLGPSYPKTSTGRRLALAKWIADPQNPRTSRIAVNHIWLRHFGEGLVASVSNFGLNGKRPTHPQLLDWLATELTDRQWSMKDIHRQMVLSSTYRLSSTDVHSENSQRDSTNRYWWHMNSRRAESEVVRDSVLYVNGELDTSFGGPEIEESKGLDVRRRSLYFRSTPNEKMAFLELFDQANPNECYRRQESVVPQQALALTNSSLLLSQARRLAAQLNHTINRSDPIELDGYIQEAFETILTRPPTAIESQACRRFLAQQTELFKATPSDRFPAANGNVAPPSPDPLQHAKENLIQVLLNHNDFVTIR